MSNLKTDEPTEGKSMKENLGKKGGSDTHTTSMPTIILRAD
jgi:hypothetical protein